MPRAVRDFSPIYPTEQVVLSFDFSPALAIGETLVTQTVLITLVAGVDATPSSRLIGLPSISGSVVMQAIGTLQAGATYDIVATVVTSTGEILTTNAHQTCLNIQ